ncbi:flagellar protein FlaG [Cytobacillus sp. IB215316]|uniref:flagellar protein FlaG n=1 Tax=Cytobacillus sp. IB215316 TaxID=3097354 RepID=UPI002A126878|nr:flagellar protein FlaG [Cytobacillus sp. IB215316]MDX8360572.1 flagellar protein FlaG [Cytobacillus sp. IB215316]
MDKNHMTTIVPYTTPYIEGQQAFKNQKNMEQNVNKLLEETITYVPKSRIEKLFDELKKFVEPTRTSIKYEYHEELEEYYVTIIDDLTKEVVREIPAKKILDLYAAMTDFIGLMVDEKI